MPADSQELLRRVLSSPDLRVVKGPDRDGWYTCWCLFHPDGKGKPPHHPNLRVNKNGYRCHACQAKGSIFDLAGKLGIDVPSDGHRNDEPVATYDYHDVDGTLLYQVVRFPPKRFLCRRPSQGGWSWGMADVTRVLYNLPALVERRDETVYVCEGEKDADRLLAAGLLATTCPHGAGKWRTEYSEVLRGRDVVLLPDNDKPGQAHAEEVAENLHRVAAAVKILMLPDLPEKGDVTDWLLSGKTTQDLVALAQRTPEYQSSAAARSTSSDAQVRETIVEQLTPRLAHLVGEENRLFEKNEEGWERIRQRRLLKRVVALMFSLSGNYPDNRKASELVKLVMNLVDNRVDYAKKPAIRFTDRTVTIDPKTGEMSGEVPPGVFSHLPYRYIPDPRPLYWLEFLRSVIPDEALRSVIQEFLGLGLFVNYNPQKALVLVGTGANGKTTLLKVLSKVFHEHTSSINVNTLEDNRLLDGLDGALFNLSEETLTEHIISSAGFKAVTGDSILLANPKYQMPYKICPTAQWLIATNHVPTFDETTIALARRLLFIPMQVTIPPEERRPVSEIVGGIEPEADEVVGWMLQGAQRYFAQRDFTYSAKAESVFRQWKCENSPILYWFNDSRIEAGEARLRSLYDRYKGWARDNGFRQMSIRSFSRHIRVLGFRTFHRNNGPWVVLSRNRLQSFEDWLESGDLEEDRREHS